MNEYKNFDLEKFEDFVFDKIVSPLIQETVFKKIDIYKNTLDPFSALIECMVRNCQPKDWIDKEKGRQSQKTLQNKIGELHEYTIDCFTGWENLKVGNIIDVVSNENKIIAEIKNKHNTTKGNHKKDIYDDISSVLIDYPGYIGYYVEILPNNKSRYNENFTPSDNTKKGIRRPSRDDIKIIDGASFYQLVSGSPYFLSDFYKKILPDALRKAIKRFNQVNGENLVYPANLESDPLIQEFFNKAY
jgi:hypothetical protein